MKRKVFTVFRLTMDDEIFILSNVPKLRSGKRLKIVVNT